MADFRFQLLALDLDGTLFDAHHDLSIRSAEVLGRLRRLRVRLILASGRPHEGIVPVARRLGLEDPILSFNGAMLQATPDGPVLFHHPIPPAWVQKVIDFALCHDYHLNLYPDGAWHVREDNEWTRLYARRTGLSYRLRPDLYAWMKGRPSTKIILFAPPEITGRLLGEWRARVGDELYVTLTEPEYLEFMAPGVSKGEALAWIQRQWGVPVERTAAFGDSLNDLPLLQAAGYAVAMGNARPELKAVAHEVAPPNEADGVARVLERWLQEDGL